jgi:Cytochrome c554 and c-prime
MRPGLVLLAIPLAASAAGTGAGQICAPCHREQAAHFQATPMARALEPAAACEILQKHPKLTFREGAYASNITREGDRSILTVTGGQQTLSVPLLWAFGRGQAGQTYVFERNGAFYESRASFYDALQGLDLTMGAQGSKPASIEEAAGRRMDTKDALACFGCHSTGAVGQPKLDLEAMAPGVGCESCHGPSATHLDAVRGGKSRATSMAKLAGMSAEEMSDLCGRCHRTWSQIALNGPRGVNNVRFQPYRLTNSKCYDAADGRIRCTACHDPHSPTESRTAFYDPKCGACHSAAGRARTCKVAKQDCATCHMPKIDLPGAHHQFTDHQIRIMRTNAPYPN